MAKKGAIKCPKCSRTFSMKAHLGRHMATIHASPGARRAAAKKSAGRKAGRPATKRTAVLSTGGNGVTGFLSDMQAYHDSLTAKRDELDGQISAIETAIGAMGGAARTAVRRGPGRPKGKVSASGTGRPGSLKDMIIKVLGQRKQPLSPNQISTAVIKAGYKSRAKDLTKAVSNVLPDIGQVKRVGFGSYTVS